MLKPCPWEARGSLQIERSLITPSLLFFFLVFSSYCFSSKYTEIKGGGGAISIFQGMLKT